MQDSSSNRVSDDLVAQARDWRHDLHRHPELAYEEHRTADLVASVLEEAGYALTRGHGGTGVVGTLQRGSGTRRIMLRADMDALPIREASGVPHASRTEGVMHACGHDGHTAMLLAAATELARSGTFDGTLHVLFQPAEENRAGARRMIEDGVLDEIDFDACFAIHNWPGLRLGQVAALDGPIMGASATFRLAVRGTGAHGAMPDGGHDTILTAARIVEAAQSIVAREVPPAKSGVISFTAIRGGDTFNVLPDRVELKGTTRWFDPAVGELLERRFREVTKAAAQMMGCSVELAYERGYPPTVNTPDEARLVREVCTGLGHAVVDSDPSLAAEDFSYFLQQKPGCYFWLGTGDADHAAGLHASTYDFNDRALPHGIAIWVRLVETCLS